MGFQITLPTLPTLPTRSTCLNTLWQTLHTGLSLCYQSTFAPIASTLVSTVANWIQEASRDSKPYQEFQKTTTKLLKTTTDGILPYLPKTSRPLIIPLLKPEKFPETMGAALGLGLSLSLGWEALLSGIVFYACLTVIFKYGYQREPDTDGKLSKAWLQDIEPMFFIRLMSLAIATLKALYTESYLPLLIYAGSTASSIACLWQTQQLLEAPTSRRRKLHKQPTSPQEQNEKRTLLFVVGIQSQLLSEQFIRFLIDVVMYLFSDSGNFTLPNPTPVIPSDSQYCPSEQGFFKTATPEKICTAETILSEIFQKPEQCKLR